MSIETEEVVATAERSSDLAMETAQTLIDSVYFAPRQTIELSQAMLRTIEANQQTGHDLAGTLVKQTLEAQTRWWQFLQESVQTATDTFARVTEASLNGARAGASSMPTASTEKRAVASRK